VFLHIYVLEQTDDDDDDNNNSQFLGSLGNGVPRVKKK